MGVRSLRPRGRPDTACSGLERIGEPRPLPPNGDIVSAVNLPGERPLWADREDPRAPTPSHEISAVEGSARSLRSLFEQHYAPVWHLLRRFGVESPQLDDAAQEVFWVAARRLGDIREGSERAFLYGVALRVASNETRRRKNAPLRAEPEEVARLVDPSPSPHEHLEQRRARQLLDVALDRLPLELRTVFVLAELEQLEVREIAELEEIPLGTANSRLRRAREEFAAIAKRIRAALAGRGGPV
jgi:RNA polymerase sigma-70 factor (ECF subfamily)